MQMDRSSLKSFGSFSSTRSKRVLKMKKTFIAIVCRSFDSILSQSWFDANWIFRIWCLFSRLISSSKCLKLGTRQRTKKNILQIQHSTAIKYKKKTIKLYVAFDYELSWQFDATIVTWETDWSSCWSVGVCMWNWLFRDNYFHDASFFFLFFARVSLSLYANRVRLIRAHSGCVPIQVTRVKRSID